MTSPRTTIVSSGRGSMASMRVFRATWHSWMSPIAKMRLGNGIFEFLSLVSHPIVELVR